MVAITGKQFIGVSRVAAGTDMLHSICASDGTRFEVPFFEATAAEVGAAASAAGSAFRGYSSVSLDRRAQFLRQIACEIESVHDDAIEAASRETALPLTRLRSEVARTTGQLRLFADVVARGEFLGPRINTASAAAPDVRQIKLPIGPVAVFGSSNFPFAFSVAGGDTASALAAGCPVVVKAHPLHMVTSELIAGAVQVAVNKASMPPGTFNMLFGIAAGALLVREPSIKAVAFTGSRQGGRALCEMASVRPEPIPVFAEMSSVNPMFLLPGALAARPKQIAAGLVESMTLGCGQFCTCPGIVIALKSSETDDFIHQVKEQVASRRGQVMLSRSLLDNYNRGVERLGNVAGVRELASGTAEPNEAAAKLFAATKDVLFSADAPLFEEVFGPSTVIVQLDEGYEFMRAAEIMKGELTASLMVEDTEVNDCRPLVDELARHVGRVLFNGFPTGVAVNESMVHGGPYPATTDPHFTSVGTLALERFLRAVCYQNAPQSVLPPGLANGNPLRVHRLVNGALSVDEL